VSDQPPAEPAPQEPPAATAAEAAQARDAAESQARLVYIAALAWIALHGDENPDESSILYRTAKTLAMRLWRSMRWQSTSKLRPPVEKRDEWVDRAAWQIVQTARHEAGAHHRTVGRRARAQNPDVTDRVVASMTRTDEAWARAAARTAATRLSAESVRSMRDLVEKDTGEPHSFMWISRGDPKVRELHRDIHGRVRPAGVPFHKWPTGQELNFPGDPKAPLDATINCRCALLMVPTKDSKHAEAVFSAPYSDFDVPMAASAASDDKRAEDDLFDELSHF
jgi:hypothetical protein